MMLGFFQKKLNFLGFWLWNFTVVLCTSSHLATSSLHSYCTFHSSYLSLFSGEDVVDAGSAVNLAHWRAEAQRVGHVCTFSQNTFFLLWESQFSVNWLQCLPKDKHFTSLVLHVCKKHFIWDIFYIFYQTAAMHPGILGSAFGKFLVETLLLQPFLLSFSCPFTSDCQMVLPPSCS